MKRFIYKASLFAIPLALPVFAFAQSGNFSNIDASITTVTNLINRIIPLLIGIGVVVFLWGLISYVTAGGDEEKKGAARSTMIYGIIVLFVMVSVWGLVRILVDTFGTGGNNTIPSYPQIP